MSKKYSYALVGDPTAFEGTKTKKAPLLSGLWLWHRAFDEYGKRGDVRLIRRKEDIEEYDLLHINMTGGNLALPQMYREVLGNSSSTKIVVNVDFDVGSWGKDWPYPTILEKQLQCADIIFHVESKGAAALEYALKRPVHVLPHPVDVVGLDNYKKMDREPYIVNIHHRYEQDITLPYWAIRDLPLYSVLLGYSKGTVPSLPMYDQKYNHLPFLDGIDIMSRAVFGLDLFHRYNYGRVVVEFAALAVPCVCSDTIDASHRCFPDLTVNPYDIKRVNELLKKLLDDDEYCEEIYKKAYEAAGYYSQEACYKRMVAVLELTEDAGGGAIQPSIDVSMQKWDALHESELRDYWTNKQTVEEHKEFWAKSEYKEKQEEQVKAIILEYCPSINSILDAGAGTCRLGKALKELGHKYVAVDFSEDMLTECGAEFETKVAKLTDLPFSDNKFDLVMCLHVIRHNNPTEYKTIVNDLCRVSGKYVLILNPFVAKKEDVKQIFEREIFDMPMMPSELDDMMTNAGFRKILVERALDDYKGLDAFMLYERNMEGAKEEDRKEEDDVPSSKDQHKQQHDKDNELWSQVQNRYERRSNKSRPEGYLKFIKEVVGKFKDFIGVHDGLMLDIGCGNGKFCGESYEARGQVYIDSKNTIIGLDPLKSTEKRFPVVCAFGEDIPFQDGSFDTVVICSVLDHIINPIVVLKEAHRVLKKEGGKIFVLNAILEEKKGNPWHLHTWTKESLIDMIGEVFTVTRNEVAGNEKGGFNLFVEGVSEK
jgi:ubiquinone/menaquinone biosynthesis C-methylase UbiE/glycosyltransferase involved in cell wall biosynthesis